MRFIAPTLHSEIKENLAEMCKTLQLLDRGTSTDDGDHQPQASASPATGSQNQPAATTGTCTKASSFNTLFGNDYFTEDADYNELNSISVSLASHPRTTHYSGGRTMRDSVSWRRNTWLYRQPPFQRRESFPRRA